MRKPFHAAMALTLAFGLFGCGSHFTGRQTRINSYLLPEGSVGGDQGKELPAVRNIIVWPMSNVAAGTNAKGVELVLTDYLVDNLYLDEAFDSVYILSVEGVEKDLLKRTGEELGLKKDPRQPVQGALVLTKIGQLTGTEALLMARVDDYDEIKLDKATYTTVGVSLFLYDAREQSYPSLDSFTPVKTLWRTNASRAAKETPFLARPTLHETARILMNNVVNRLRRDFSKVSEAARRELEEKISGLRGQASEQVEAGEFDAAVATWDEIAKIDPDNGELESAKERIEAARKAAEEQAKLQEVQEQIEGTKTSALELEEAGDLEGALTEWKKILELNAEHEEARGKVESLTGLVSAAQAKDRETEIAKNLHLAQQALGDSRYSEAVEAANKVLAVTPENAKAQSIKEAAELKLEEAKAAEGDAAPAPLPEIERKVIEEPPAKAPTPEKKAVEKKAVEKKVEEKAAEKKPAGAEDPAIEKLRSQAMEYFNGEDYVKAEEVWKKLLEAAPEDKQALEMLETTQMLIEALK